MACKRCAFGAETGNVPGKVPGIVVPKWKPYTYLMLGGKGGKLSNTEKKNVSLAAKSFCKANPDKRISKIKGEAPDFTVYAQQGRFESDRSACMSSPYAYFQMEKPVMIPLIPIGIGAAALIIGMITIVVVLKKVSKK